MMIGREIGERYPVRSSKIGETVLKVKGPTKQGVFQDVNFEVHSGRSWGFRADGRRKDRDHAGHIWKSFL